MKTLGAAPFGKFLLLLAAVGLAAYGAYGFIRARTQTCDGSTAFEGEASLQSG